MPVWVMGERYFGVKVNGGCLRNTAVRMRTKALPRFNAEGPGFPPASERALDGGGSGRAGAGMRDKIRDPLRMPPPRGDLGTRNQDGAVEPGRRRGP